jgi:hypothetical protein
MEMDMMEGRFKEMEKQCLLLKEVTVSQKPEVEGKRFGNVQASIIEDLMKKVKF